MNIINEVNRIKQIMFNGGHGETTITEDLLLEVTIPPLVEKTLRKLKLYKNETNIVSLLNRVETSVGSFEVKLVNFIRRNINSQAGLRQIRGFFKEACELNYNFAEDFINLYYKDFENMLNNQTFDYVYRTIEFNYGKNVADLFAQKLNEGSWIKRLSQNVFNFIKNKSQQITKRIFPDYKQIQDKVIEDYKKLLTETDGAKIIELEKSIKQGMDTLNQSKRKYVEEINKTIEGKIRSGSQTEKREYQKIKNILDKIKTEKGDWGVIQVSSKFSQEGKIFSDAVKSTFSLEKNIGKLIGKLNIFTRIKNFAKYFAGELKNNTGNINNSVNTVKETPWYKKLVKFLFFATPRGLPRKDGRINLDNPSAYDEILKYSGKFGAYRSFAYELILRGIKFQFYFAILETLMFFFKFWKYDKYIENPCCNEVSENMLKNNIKSVDEYMEFIENNYTNAPDKIPNCLKNLISKKDDESAAGMIMFGYYRSQPQERKKWLGVIVQNIMNIDLMKIFTRLIPIARIYEFIDQITYAGEVYLATGDRTEYENQLERIRGEQEQMERELSDIDTTNPNPPEPVPQNFTDDENGLIEYLRTINKEYRSESYLKAEGEAPSEGQDTEYNMYYFENNKWGLAN